MSVDVIDAQAAQAEHAAVVKMVMAAIDLVDWVQRGPARPDIPKLRRSVGKALRRSQILHSVAIAALVLDAAPEYAGELMDRAAEIDRHLDAREDTDVDLDLGEHTYGDLAPLVEIIEELEDGPRPVTADERERWGLDDRGAPIDAEERESWEGDPVTYYVMQRVQDAFEELMAALDDRRNVTGVMLDASHEPMRSALAEKGGVPPTPEELNEVRDRVDAAQSRWAAAISDADATLRRRQEGPE